jgi:hypothetical protein
MLIHFLKFTHMVFVLALLGSTIYALVLIASKKFALANRHLQSKLARVNKIILCSILAALTTGTLLVHPKLHTFHTPWIEAAFILSVLSGTLVLCISIFRHRFKPHHRRTWLAIYGSLGIVLLGIVHGAVLQVVF